MNERMDKYYGDISKSKILPIKELDEALEKLESIRDIVKQWEKEYGTNNGFMEAVREMLNDDGA